MSGAAKILVVEDDPHIRRLLRAALERSDHRVSEAATAREALALADIVKPDVVLLDLGLPDRDGLEVIQLLKAKAGAGVIVVSAREDTSEKVTALDLGADDYLVKPFDTEELLARVRSALRHRPGLGPADGPARYGDLVIDLAHRRIVRGGVEIHLTPKEYAVFAELARRPDRVIGHRQLLAAGWGAAQQDRLDYLRIVVRGLRQKLETDAARPELIVNEMGIGYRLRVAPDPAATT